MLLKIGFEKVKSWECLFVNRSQQLFLSVYVDDFKMAGKRENIGGMWDKITKAGLEIDPPVPLHNNVYLGCGQEDVTTEHRLVSIKNEMLTRLMNAEVKNGISSSSETDKSPSRSGPEDGSQQSGNKKEETPGRKEL